MYRNILILFWIFSGYFVNHATSHMIALTGSRHQNPFPARTSVSQNIKTLLTNCSPTPAPATTLPPRRTEFPLVKRQSDASSCGDYDIPGFSMRLNMGQTCLVDENGLMFGACSTAVTDASRCGWPGICVDKHACTSSCGRTSVPNVSITTCGGDGNDYCAMWFLVTGLYVYTSLTCSDKQSWSTWEASLVTTTSAMATFGQPFDTSEAAPTENPESSSSSSSTQTSKSSTTAPSTLTINVGNPSGTSNSTIDTSSQDTRSPAVILGVVFGVIGGLAIIVALIWFLRRRHESQKRASRALAYDPGHSSDDPEAPHVMGSRHEGSVHCSIGSPQLTGGPSLGAQMGYVDSPLGSPEIGDGSIYKGGVRSSVTSPISPLAPSLHGEDPVFEMHADAIGPAELPA